MMRNKNDIPQEVIDYCIDNRVSIEEGMVAFIDRRLEAVDQDLAVFKKEVDETAKQMNRKVTAEEMADVEDFLNSFEQTNV